MIKDEDIKKFFSYEVMSSLDDKTLKTLGLVLICLIISIAKPSLLETSINFTDIKLIQIIAFWLLFEAVSLFGHLPIILFGMGIMAIELMIRTIINQLIPGRKILDLS